MTGMECFLVAIVMLELWLILELKSLILKNEKRRNQMASEINELRNLYHR